MWDCLAPLAFFGYRATCGAGRGGVGEVLCGAAQQLPAAPGAAVLPAQLRVFRKKRTRSSSRFTSGCTALQALGLQR